MQASIENGEGLKRILSIVIEQDNVKKAYDEVAKKLMKEVRVDGFRKGHVPRNIIEQRYKGDLISRTYDKLLKENMSEALKQTEAKNATFPEPYFAEGEVFDLSPDADLTLKVIFETFPADLNLDFSAIKVKQVQSTIGDADIDRMIDNLRSQRAVWQTEDNREAQKGDRVNIDFVGKKDGEPFANGSASGFNLVLEEGNMIPGFIDPIIGHKEGDEFTFNIKFPEDYHVEELKGQDTSFDIKVNAVAVKVLPEVNEDFVKSFNVADGSIEKFRSELKANMEREQANVMRAQNHESVFNALLETAGDFDVPEAWVEENRVNLCNAEEARLSRYIGMKKFPGHIADNKEAMRDEAFQTTRLQWIAQEINRAFEIKQPSEQSIENQLNSFAGAYEDPEEVKAEIRKDKKQYSQLLRLAMEDDLVNAVLSKAQVETENTTFSDLIYKSQNA